MNNTFTAQIPLPPEGLTLKATLSFKYFFESGWACAHTSDGCWIVTDEGRDLGNALIFPDEESFVSWLELTASEHLAEDLIEYLRLFCSVPELITPEVAFAMLAVINSPDTHNEPRGSD